MRALLSNHVYLLYLCLRGRTVHILPDTQDSMLLPSLKVGDQVQGRLKAKDSNYVITELQKR